MVPHFIFVKDETGKFEIVNKATAEVFGTTVEDLTGRKDVDFVANDAELVNFWSDDFEVIKSGKIKFIPEEKITDSENKTRYLQTTKVPFKISGTEISALLGIAVDITDRKHTEQQIIRLNHLREELLGLTNFNEKLIHITDAVVDIFDADFCRVWIIKSADRCNDSCPHAEATEGPHVCLHRERCLHLAASSGRYSGLDSAMHGRVPFGCYKIGMIASGAIESFNTNDVTHDSQVHDHDWAKKLGLVSFAGYCLFSDKGLPIGVIALFSKHAIDPHEAGLLEGVANSTSQVIQMNMDDTEKEAMRANLHRAQKMEAIGLMASGVAHDLNNILAGIVSYPELLLLQLAETSELRKPIEEIRDSGKRAATVVADLLTVARGAASTKTPCDVNVLIQDYLDSPEFSKLASLHPGVICTKLLNAGNPIINCSSVHIRKTIMNLLTNAMEALGEKGNVTVTTANQTIEKTDILENKIPPGSYVLITICDDGPGIASKDLNHIFEPFYTKKIMGRSGTGLGLSIVWNTVQDHNGEIFVESNEKGSIFQLYFPLSTEEIISDCLDTNTVQTVPPKDTHILVVDDEPQLRDIASQILKTIGYKVDSVCSGELAVTFVKDNPVDLIVMDMLMEPGMNGRQTYEEILKLNPNQKTIVTSGFSESTDIKATLELGANGFIKKPYSMANLDRAVKEALDN